VFPSDLCRIIGVDEFDLDMPLEGDFLLTKHDDMPGMIGKIGTLLGQRGINIARMGVGRADKGGKALMLISVDQEVGKKVVEEFRALPNFKDARSLILSHMRNREYMNI